MAEVRCEKCDAPVERHHIETNLFSALAGAAPMPVNQPCGCENAGLVFDFTNGQNDGPPTSP